MVKVVEASTLPLGPLMDVVGVWSSVLNDSTILVALVVSPVPPVGAVNACAMTRRLRFVAIVAEILHVRVVPLPRSRVAFRPLLATTRPSIGAVIVVSGAGAGNGTELKS